MERVPLSELVNQNSYVNAEQEWTTELDDAIESVQAAAPLATAQEVTRVVGRAFDASGGAYTTPTEDFEAEIDGIIAREANPRTSGAGRWYGARAQPKKKGPKKKITKDAKRVARKFTRSER